LSKNQRVNRGSHRYISVQIRNWIT